jgi:hypothetical protein
MREKTKTIAANAVAITLVALLLFWGNTQYRQWHQFRLGEKALAAGDAIGAIAGFESAIHMYTPLSPLVERAATRLWELGESLERQGEAEKALIAYRALRSSFYAARGLFQPGQDWIERCENRIPQLASPAQPAK